MSRTIYFTRKVQMNGKWAPFYIYIDNQPVAKIGSGETVGIPVDSRSHSFGVCAEMGDGKHWSNKHILLEGKFDKYYTISTKTRLLGIDVLIVED